MRGLHAAALLLFSSSGLAQTGASERLRDTGTPGWMEAWSPLRPIADHIRTLPWAPELPQLLLAERPRIGLFWTAGNPAGLAFEVPDRRVEFRGAYGGEQGSYRRPLDDRDAGILQLYGLGWRPLGEGAAVGRVTLDVENTSPASFADVVVEHPSNPLIVADTSLPDLRRVRARLEGGLGRRFGGWAVGLTAGIDVQDNRTRDARFPRLTRMSTPAVAVGVARRLPVAASWLSVHARWIGNRERISLIGQPGTGLVYQLEGYTEPVPLEVEPPQIFYSRQMDRRAWSWGLSVKGQLLGLEGLLAWESTCRAEEHFSQFVANPPADEWDVSGNVWALALQRSFAADGRLLVTGHVRYSQLEGSATRFDLEGDIFRADESLIFLGGDVRYLPPRSPWSAGLGLALVGESRLRRDFIAEVGTDIETWRPGATLELARNFGATTIAAGFAFASHSATSTLPNPELMGPVYQQLIAPELSLYATHATATTFGISLRQRLGARTALLLRARGQTLSLGEPGDRLPFTPSGDRTLWNVLLSVVLGGVVDQSGM